MFYPGTTVPAQARPVAAATAVPSARAHSAPAAVSAPSRPVRTPRPSLADTLLSAAARWIARKENADFLFYAMVMFIEKHLLK